MGKIIRAYIFPHPPILIPDIGKGKEKEAMRTIEACVKAAGDIASDRPGTVILTSPHAPLFQDYIYISSAEKLRGDFGAFRASEIAMSFDNNIVLAGNIAAKAREHDIPAGSLEKHIMKRYGITDMLDHGAMVPLYFIDKVFKGFKLVLISLSGLPAHELYKFGMCIAEAVSETDEDVVFIGSGDLSHKLTIDAPYGYNAKGEIFDRAVTEAISKNDPGSLIEMDPGLCESAAECGLRSFIMMYGALDGYELHSEVYSYEGPFGVGYAVARINPGQQSRERRMYGNFLRGITRKIAEYRKNEDPYVLLARETLEAFVTGRDIPEVSNELPEEMRNKKAGVFVSIKKHGQLRGCIGTTSPTQKNIAEEIMRNSISAGTGDPRFDPVGENELEDLVYSVDVLTESEPIKSVGELDVKKYGVIVKSGYRSGLLLPDLEGVDTPEKQVEIALRKAGIDKNDSYRMERFEVIRHH
ncbi:MAG: AmmeMemoRadiSam system protein A [Eubacteriales bacterium]|nr:AmmeMemoRadiSam system protein A [Eubacteriales bacterium]